MNKKEIKKLIEEGDEHRILDYYDSEESKEKRIEVVDTVIDLQEVSQSLVNRYKRE